MLAPLQWTESLDSRGLVEPTLTVISGLRAGMRQTERRAVCTRSHASTVKKADQFEVVQLSLTWKLSFKSSYL